MWVLWKAVKLATRECSVRAAFGRVQFFSITLLPVIGSGLFYFKDVSMKSCTTNAWNNSSESHQKISCFGLEFLPQTFRTKQLTSSNVSAWWPEIWIIHFLFIPWRCWASTWNTSQRNEVLVINQCRNFSILCCILSTKWSLRGSVMTKKYLLLSTIISVHNAPIVLMEEVWARYFFAV